MEKERKMIIRYTEDVSEKRVLDYVNEVVRQGRISKANNKKHFCFVTRFNDKTIVVVKPKYGTDSDIFIVYKEGKQLN